MNNCPFQVVITNHDYDETDEEMSPRCRKLSRSLSSPDGLRVSSKMRNQVCGEINE